MGQVEDTLDRRKLGPARVDLVGLLGRTGDLECVTRGEETDNGDLVADPGEHVRGVHQVEKWAESGRAAGGGREACRSGETDYQQLVGTVVLSQGFLYLISIPRCCLITSAPAG